MSVFRKFDAGEGHRTPRAGKDRDCQVRALATARGIPYPNAWATLYLMQGERRACSFTLVDDLKIWHVSLGVTRALHFPSEKGTPRMTAAAFCKKHRKGNFILRMAHHVAAVKDGQLYDTWDSSRRCVYAAWKIEPASHASGTPETQDLPAPEDVCDCAQRYVRGECPVCAPKEGGIG